MTKEQKQQILTLHQNSLGFTKIGSILGISAGAVRMYRKRHSTAGPDIETCENKKQQLDLFARIVENLCIKSPDASISGSARICVERSGGTAIWIK